MLNLKLVIASTLLTLAVTNVSALSVKSIFMPSIQTVPQARQAAGRSVRYMRRLKPIYASIHDWNGIRLAMYHSPWCRVYVKTPPFIKVKFKGSHGAIVHFSSYGIPLGRYAFKTNNDGRRDWLFQRSRKALKVCSSPYDISVLQKPRTFIEGKKKYTLVYAPEW